VTWPTLDVTKVPVYSNSLTIFLKDYADPGIIIIIISRMMVVGRCHATQGPFAKPDFQTASQS
jgi:hypothetical protein